MTEQKGCRYWITSDTHFSHQAIIRFVNRPFKNSKEMDEALIENWNSCVSDKDFVIHLGDFAFVRNEHELDRYIDALKGKIILVRGNHDRYTKRKSHLFYEYHHSGQYEIRIDGEKYFLNHYPMLSWNRSFHGSIHFFGHVHSQNGATWNSDVDDDDPNRRIPFLCQINSYDVGVDNNEMKPILLEKAVEKARSPLHKLTTGPV